MTCSRLAARHPILTAAACALLQFLLTMAILMGGRLLLPAAAFGTVKLVAFASTVVLPLVLVQVFGLWRQVGLGADRIRPAPVFLVCMLLVPLYLSIGIRAPAGGLGGDLLVQFINAFGEELLFRGVVFAILLRLPAGPAIVLNGLLFGAMHLLHGFMGADWSAAAWQAMLTSLGGMMFTAVRMRTGSLWLAIVLHMCKNLAVMYSDVGAVAGTQAMALLQGVTVLLELAVVGYAIVATNRERRAGPVPQTMPS